jgi:hypothetical protein
MDTQRLAVINSTMPASSLIYLTRERCSFTDDELVMAAQNGASAAAGDHRKCGVVTSVWDRMFGAIQSSKKRKHLRV